MAKARRIFVKIMATEKRLFAVLCQSRATGWIVCEQAPCSPWCAPIFWFRSRNARRN